MECEGRITIEHAFTYAGKQINELWALIPLCEYHHLGEGLIKRENQRIAVARATDEELSKYPRINWDNYENLTPVTGKKRRTNKQNRSMHLYCDWLAESLNEAGLDMRKVLKPSIEIPWTRYMVKEFLWKAVLKQRTGKETTTEMTRNEVDDILDILNAFVAQKGMHVRFPSKESLENYPQQGLNQGIDTTNRTE